MQLINERGRRSELSGERLDEPLDESVEMHEVFVSRDMVRAWPEDRKKLIFHHYNMVILKQSEHKVATSKGNRAILAKKLIARYGKASIQEWLDGLGLKYRLELSQWD